MLIGVLCEVVTTVKIREQEKAMIRDTQDRLKNIFLLGDIDGSGTISHDEFEAMSEYKEVLDALGELEIKPTNFSAIAAVLFEDETDPAKSKSLIGRRGCPSARRTSIITVPSVSSSTA